MSKIHIFGSLERIFSKNSIKFLKNDLPNNIRIEYDKYYDNKNIEIEDRNDVDLLNEFIYKNINNNCFNNIKYGDIMWIQHSYISRLYMGFVFVGINNKGEKELYCTDEDQPPREWKEYLKTLNNLDEYDDICDNILFQDEYVDFNAFYSLWFSLN